MTFPARDSAASSWGSDSNVNRKGKSAKNACGVKYNRSIPCIVSSLSIYCIIQYSCIVPWYHHYQNFMKKRLTHVSLYVIFMAFLWHFFGIFVLQTGCKFSVKQRRKQQQSLFCQQWQTITYTPTVKVVKWLQIFYFKPRKEGNANGEKLRNEKGKCEDLSSYIFLSE